MEVIVIGEEDLEREHHHHYVPMTLVGGKVRQRVMIETRTGGGNAHGQLDVGGKENVA
jgi:hypothetical protein